jgi:CTP synthase
MSPYQHGEVFVTQDGAETDLDLGNYERFIDVELSSESNVPSGQIYSAVIKKERRGDFLGGTIQVVPHLTNEIKDRFKKLADRSKADVIIIEVGGTVGDIEGQPFLEAIRQMRKDAGRDNVLYVHVTFLPYLSSTQEVKSKPTQHSVNELRRIGIQPDIIICRSDYPIPSGVSDKIALFCDVERRAVIPLLTVRSIYEVPIVLEAEGLGELVVNRLGIKAEAPDLSSWRELVERLKTPHDPVNIALVGKYVELKDAYYSVREALCHAASFLNRDINLQWVQSEDLEKENGTNVLRTAQGIVVPGGFGNRGTEGMIKAAEYARIHKVPYLGLCLGMQLMVAEYARNVVGMARANSTEFDPETPFPVIDLMPEQKKVLNKGATMRLGNYPCRLVEGTLAAKAYGTDFINERHRHRYEFNNTYRAAMAEAGLIYSGLSPDGELVEMCELPTLNHPWMLGCQFHPEFGSRPSRPHPLFRDFIGCAKDILREGAQTPLALPL